VTLRHHRCADVTDLKGGKVGILRYRRRGSHRPSRVRSKWLALLFLLAAVVTWQFARQQPSSEFSHSPSGKPESGLLQGQRGDYPSQARQSDSKLLARGVNRLVYPYSVIRGGVANPDELKRMMEYDPVVSRHFKGFDYQRARVVQVSEKQAMYVSYRIGDRVYWTRRKVSLHPGETLITDGAIVARTRCGNRVAPVPLDAGSPLEPSTEELELPVILRDPDPSPPVLATVNSVPDKSPPAVIPPAKGSGWWFIPPPVYIPSGGSGGTLAVTPEPGSILLISSGLAAVYWRSRKARKKK
jgi:hypothetical protein